MGAGARAGGKGAETATSRMALVAGAPGGSPYGALVAAGGDARGGAQGDPGPYRKPGRRSRGPADEKETPAWVTSGTQHMAKVLQVVWNHRWFVLLGESFVVLGEIRGIGSESGCLSCTVTLGGPQTDT